MKIRTTIQYILSVFVLGTMVFSSCNTDDTILTDSGLSLRFSTDTLTFDTVFTQIGSTTLSFKVYNDNDGAVELNNFRLSGGSASFFRYNVDGLTSDQLDKISIPSNDSIYVFVEVTVDPDQNVSASPFIINEELLMDLNGDSHSITLSAWGQNANYIPQLNAKGALSKLTCDLNTITWDDPKPYIIYGIFVIDSCELVIPEGTEIYVYGGVGRIENDNEISFFNEGLILINPDGKLTTQGTKENPVLFTDSRLEEEFDTQSGQWSGIRALNDGQIDFSYTRVENSTVGLWADSAAVVNLQNTTIQNTSSFGLVAINAAVNAKNCLFTNNGEESINITYGGNYSFDYCTISSSGNKTEGLRLSNYFCLDANTCFYTGLTARFRNCVFSGSTTDEINLDNLVPAEDPAFFDYSFTNSAVQVNEVLEDPDYADFMDRCKDCIILDNTEKLYQSIDERNFIPDSSSVLLNKAIPISDISTDIDDNLRSNTTPDIGCYELSE